MAFDFDDVFNKTKSVAEEFGKKSAEAIEISKKKIELIDCKNKLNKAYSVLGKIQYDLICGVEPDSDQVKHSVDEIEKYIDKIQSLEYVIHQATKTKECPACGSDVKGDGAYCNQCGASLK